STFLICYIYYFCTIFLTSSRIFTILFVFITLSLFFFFSSRRRHTRFSRDWSSDVCSSDLISGLHSRNPPPPPEEGTGPSPDEHGDAGHHRSGVQRHPPPVDGKSQRGGVPPSHPGIRGEDRGQVPEVDPVLRGPPSSWRV